MKRGFYTIMAAQFFSSFADQMLLIAAIQMLLLLEGPEWLTPLLRFFFTISYVVLAAFVGAFADSMPKGRVMFITNTLKIFGCSMILLSAGLTIPGMHTYWLIPIAYGIVGLGAAAYSPAKYGILTELLPPEQLVVANGWIEGLTIASIVLGFVVGGILISPEVSTRLLKFDLPMIDTPIDTAPEVAIMFIGASYIIAAIFNLMIPDTGARYPQQNRNPLRMLEEFSRGFHLLWRDKLGQISLAVTTLFWGAGATLQFITLKWAEKQLQMPLDRASILQGISALGIALGAVIAARTVPLKKSLRVLPMGIAMGFVAMSLVWMKWMPGVYVVLLLVGALAGYFVVPMNALLQHRGHVLLSAGHSIAVQNFNENISILVMLALYSVMIRMHVPINLIIVMFGAFVALTMLMVMKWNQLNHARDPDLDRHIGEAKH